MSNAVPVARVSVIVPCYNTERYLGDALESIVSQVPAPDEVLVVDDGSDDASAAVAARFAGSVRCFRQPHRGAGAARNHGLREARGDVIAFLDADDLWPDESLACRLALLADDAAAEVVCGLTQQFISPDLPRDVRERFVCPPTPSAGEAPGALLMRRRAVERIGPFNETLRVGETVDWISRARAARVVFRPIDRVVLRRRIHGGNTGAGNHHWRADYLRVLKDSLNRRRAGGALPESRGTE